MYFQEGTQRMARLNCRTLITSTIATWCLASGTMSFGAVSSGPVSDRQHDKQADAGAVLPLRFYRAFQACFTGPDETVPPFGECPDFDYIADEHIDLRDFEQLLLDVYPGLDVPGDNCFFPIVIEDGDYDISTIGATSDGYDEPAACPGDASVIHRDFWFRYRAACSGSVTVSTCGTSFDTILAVYDGAACPPPDSAVACNDDGCGQIFLASRVTHDVAKGNDYMIRLGGFNNASGTGFLHVQCGQAPLCPDNAAGDCLDANGNGSPGCRDQACCDAICPLDWYCCDVEWDNVCAAEAEGICGEIFDSCETATGDCFITQTEPGCSDPECCQQVCEVDVFCCLDVWDFFCVDQAEVICRP